MTEAMKNDIAVASGWGLLLPPLRHPYRQGTGPPLMAALFEAYITNLGKYNEGELVGETLKFPLPRRRCRRS